MITLHWPSTVINSIRDLPSYNINVNMHFYADFLKVKNVLENKRINIYLNHKH